MLNCRLEDGADGAAIQPARIATRIVMDQHARLPLAGRLVQSARDLPLWVVVVLKRILFLLAV